MDGKGAAGSVPSRGASRLRVEPSEQRFTTPDRRIGVRPAHEAQDVPELGMLLLSRTTCIASYHARLSLITKEGGNIEWIRIMSPLYDCPGFTGSAVM